MALQAFPVRDTWAGRPVQASKHLRRVLDPKNLRFLRNAGSTRVRVIATSAAPSSELKVEARPNTETAVQLLKTAAKEGGVPTTSVAEAIRVLEKAKVQAQDWKALLGGEDASGRTWKLIFTSGAKRAQNAFGDLAKGGGIYIPITFVQRWNATKNEIANGVYLGHLASVSLHGSFEMDGSRLPFDITTLRIKIGPFQRDFGLPEKFGHIKEGASKSVSPFFLFAYVDDEVCVARGRGGGVALWARMSPAWDLAAGIL